MSAVDMAVALARSARVPPARDDGANLLLDLLPDLTHADTTQEATGLTSRTGSLPDLSLTPLRPYQTKPLSRRHPPEPDDPGPASPLTPAATRTQKRARYLGPPPPLPAALSLFTEVLQQRVHILNNIRIYRLTASHIYYTFRPHLYLSGCRRVGRHRWAAQRAARTTLRARQVPDKTSRSRLGLQCHPGRRATPKPRTPATHVLRRPPGRGASDSSDVTCTARGSPHAS